MKKSLILLLLIFSAHMLKAQENSGATGSTKKHHKSKKSKREVSKEKIHYGTASFYANKFEGRERFSVKKNYPLPAI
jgi:rare lipoprotein A (peptidoglycan hydrolase)